MSGRVGSIRGALVAVLLAAGVGACRGAPPPDPWSAYRGSDDPARIEAFLERHPDSPSVEEARARLAELRERDDRRAAEEAGTREAWAAYLAAHPASDHADEARALVARLDEEAAWSALRDAGAEDPAGYRRFLATYPASAHAAEAREVLARADARAALERARSADTLAAWETFVRAHPAAEGRAEAGVRIEELVGEAPEAVRAAVEEAAALVRDVAAKEGDASRHDLVVDMARAAPGMPDHVLAKTGDYDYVAITTDDLAPAPGAFEEPALRFLPPFQVLVVRLGEDTLFSSDDAIGRRLIELLWEVAELRGTSFVGRDFLVHWPRDVEAFRLPDDRVSYQRGFLANVLTPTELLRSLARVPEEHVAWAAGHVQRAGVEPATDAECVALALAAGTEDWRAPGEAAHAPLLALAAADAPAPARRATRALALADPGGRLFERLPDEAAERVGAYLTAAIVAEPELAAGFADAGAPRAATARARACEALVRTFEREDDDEAARRAARDLPLLGWDPDEPRHRVRTLALEERWDDVRALRAEAVVPLLEMLTGSSTPRSTRAQRLLEDLAGDVGVLAAANERLRADADVRLAVLESDGAARFPGLFDGPALDYLRAAQAPDVPAAMTAFADACPDPTWAALARAWVADAEPRPLQEVAATGRVAVRLRGRDIRRVHVLVENLTDHPVGVVVPAGLRFASAASHVQDMVTLRAVVMTVRGRREAAVDVPAACADLDLAIPTSRQAFTLEVVDPDSDLGRLLAELARREFDPDVAQAAVWIVTDDATMSELGRLQLVRLHATRGERQIQAPEALRALLLLDAIGLDVHGRNAWRTFPATTAELDPELTEALADLRARAPR